MRSDDALIIGGVRSTDGWWTPTPSDPHDETYQLLQNEGYEEDLEPRDMYDEFDRPGAQ
jgi:hypothetical protein